MPDKYRKKKIKINCNSPMGQACGYGKFDNATRHGQASVDPSKKCRTSYKV